MRVSSASRQANRTAAVASWVAVVAWMGVIFYMSSKTGIKVWNPMTYVAHFSEYLILGVLLCVALHVSTSLNARTLLLVALIAASAYGISDELHQGFVPTREVSVWDWLTDTAGASTALLVWTVVLRARLRPAVDDDGGHLGPGAVVENEQGSECRPPVSADH